ncbi:MAG: nucleotide sugar dehydrogenase [Candidatus Lambdaproteobacteria bacterium]|nr:nucleotide sugar dehydrogenase [Candidatus Lambdaproteobacteria bacterium]
MTHNRKLSVIGLGYVGLPVAVAFGRQGHVVGLDINSRRVAALRAGSDSTHEVAPEDLRAADIHFTSDPADLAGADFHIVAVPTPVDQAKQPDFGALIGASTLLGRQLKRGDIAVYESTVYPGATEEICVPVLERESGLRCGVDFSVGYSPERINPGDKLHTFTSITKVVSGLDAATLDIVAAVYGSVVQAGVHRAPTIRTAEAAKVIENIQRDLNIALMNELAVIFDKLGIDTLDVLAAAGTKWNFLNFRPGLVGGHCIGVDPYYLTHKAEKIGLHPQVILSGRRINDSMSLFVANRVIKGLIAQDVQLRGASVAVLGLTFKENVPDLRNTKVIDVVQALEEFGLRVQVADPVADPAEARHEYGIDLVPLDRLRPAQAVVLAVAHEPFRGGGWPPITRLLHDGKGFVADVKGILDPAQTPPGVVHWRL